MICDSISKESPESTIDQAMLLDVLEHVRNAGEFLNNIHHVMKKDGCIIITVPAFMSLWSSEDASAGHFKRYRLEELRNEMEAAGFEVQYISYFMGFLYVPILLVRVYGERLGIIRKTQDRTSKEQEKIMEQQFKSRTGIVKAVLEFLEKYERKKIKAGRQVRFGSSLIAVGKSKELS